MGQNRGFGGPGAEGLLAARVGEAIEADPQAAPRVLPLLVLGFVLATKTVRALNRTADWPCPERAAAACRIGGVWDDRLALRRVVVKASERKGRRRRVAREAWSSDRSSLKRRLGPPDSFVERFQAKHRVPWGHDRAVAIHAFTKRTAHEGMGMHQSSRALTFPWRATHMGKTPGSETTICARPR